MTDIIPFHRPFIEEHEVQAVADVLRNGWLTMGHVVKQFEEEFAAKLGVSHAVSVNSCTAALHLALEAVGLKQGDEVIVPVMTFAATAEVVTYFGAKPVFVDIEKDTHNLDAAKIEQLITERTKVIIPVHYAGMPVDMAAVREMTDKHGLIVLEDAAHALPATYEGNPVGTIGDLTAFSFYATKTLAIGEGGMVTTENEEWANRIRMMRIHGMSRAAWKRNTSEGSWHYDVLEPGFKYNLTDTSAALGRTQLHKLDKMRDIRAAIAEAYKKQLDPDLFEFLREPSGRKTAWHLFVAKLNKGCKVGRNELINRLAEENIICSVHFIPLNLQPAYQRYGYVQGDFPVAEAEYSRMLSLPLWCGMTDQQISGVADSMNRIAGEG